MYLKANVKLFKQTKYLATTNSNPSRGLMNLHYQHKSLFVTNSIALSAHRRIKRTINMFDKMITGTNLKEYMALYRKSNTWFIPEVFEAFRN